MTESRMDAVSDDCRWKMFRQSTREKYVQHWSLSTSEQAYERLFRSRLARLYFGLATLSQYERGERNGERSDSLRVTALSAA